MHVRIFIRLCLHLVLAIFPTSTVFSFSLKDDKQVKSIPSVTQSTLEAEGTLVNINNMSLWLYADGASARNPDGDAGAIFPRGTAPVIFQDGLIWGGQVMDGQEPIIRVGGQTYISGTVPGSIISQGLAEDFNDPNVNRIWRIRRDYFNADLTQDAAELNLKQGEEVTPAEIAAVRARYERDWREWPWQKGAPFYDADRDGVYSPRFNADGSPKLFPEADEPGYANAEQVVWFVFNDLNEQLIREFAGSPPIGLETQVTLWGYDRENALGNVIFKQYRFIYKGTESTPETAFIDSLYVGQWSDADLGSFGDDQVGCDILLDLSYSYNASNQDYLFAQFNLTPPAVGYDFFAGPIIRRSYGKAIFGLKELSGYINLPMTAFGFFAAGGADEAPSCCDYNVTLQWWNLLRGFRPRPETPPQPWFNPETQQSTKFVLSGDPVTGSGWIDSNPGDRRMIASSGPFRLAFGDTNEVTLGVVAGLASDRLLSILTMKYYDRVVQQLFDHLLETPEPPPAPGLSASELDGKIILNWGGTQEEVERIESSDIAGFKFEGYNLYQLPSPDANMDESVKLATFDLDNEVTVIIQEEFLPDLAVIITTPAQSGTNSGVVRTRLIERDEIRDEPLLNGREYHFAVTSYSYAPDRFAGIKSLESKPSVITVIPQWLRPGVSLGAAVGDTLPVRRIQGNSDARILPVVVDPTRLTGDEYQLTFEKTEDDRLVWNLFNLSQENMLLSGMTNFSGQGDYLVTQGTQVFVINPPPGIKQQDKLESDDPETWGWDVPAGELRFTWEGGADGFHFEGFHGAIGWACPYNVFAGGRECIAAGKLNPVLLKLAQVDEKDGFDPNDPNVSFGYRYGRGFFSPPARPEFTPFILNSEAGYAYQEFTRSVPLAAFDISDPDNPRRLVVGHLENNAEDGMVDGKWWPPNFQFFDNTAGAGPREWLWIFDADYSEMPNPEFQQEAINNPLPIMYWLTVARRGEVPFSPGGSGEDQFAIFPNHPLTEEDEFTFQTPAPEFDQEQARVDVLKQVNVFPNPYYGLFRLSARPEEHFVTFSHLPAAATVRIFTLAGGLVRKLEKDDSEQFLRWDLKNEHGRQVAGGLYIAHIEMPELRVSKVLKLAVFVP